MKKAAPKKMKLSRETVATLTNDQAKMVHGMLAVGQQQREIPWTSDSAKVCCA